MHFPINNSILGTDYNILSLFLTCSLEIGVTTCKKERINQKNSQNKKVYTPLDTLHYFIIYKNLLSNFSINSSFVLEFNTSSSSSSAIEISGIFSCIKIEFITACTLS